jgi:hypothetical protein
VVLYILRQVIVVYRKTLSWNVPEEIDSNNETYAIYWYIVTPSMFVTKTTTLFVRLVYNVVSTAAECSSNIHTLFLKGNLNIIRLLTSTWSTWSRPADVPTYILQVFVTPFSSMPRMQHTSQSHLP